jgi:hypothetical protein
VWPRLPFKPLVLFVYMYLVRRGFLDGRPGLILCVFHAWQEFVVGIKLAELRSRGPEVEASRVTGHGSRVVGPRPATRDASAASPDASEASK